MSDDRCWACGVEGDHPKFGGHYWPCGTMKVASIRGEACYENEIEQLTTILKEFIKIADNIMNTEDWDSLNQIVSKAKGIIND